MCVFSCISFFREINFPCLNDENLLITCIFFSLQISLGAEYKRSHGICRNVSFFKRVNAEMNAKDDFNDLADPDVAIEVEADNDDPTGDVYCQPRPILRDPVRRSGRRCRVPVKFQDFVLYSSWKFSRKKKKFLLSFEMF